MYSNLRERGRLLSCDKACGYNKRLSRLMHPYKAAQKPGKIKTWLGSRLQ
jgi:hypothetical protein